MKKKQRPKPIALRFSINFCLLARYSPDFESDFKFDFDLLAYLLFVILVDNVKIKISLIHYTITYFYTKEVIFEAQMT